MIRLPRPRLEKFLFFPESDTWLGFLPLSVALQVIFYCLSLRKDWGDLFTLNQAGMIKRDLSEAILSAQSRYIPRFGWLVDLFISLGCSEQTAVAIGWWICSSALAARNRQRWRSAGGVSLGLLSSCS